MQDSHTLTTQESLRNANQATDGRRFRSRGIDDMAEKKIFKCRYHYGFYDLGVHFTSCYLQFIQTLWSSTSG